MQRYINGGCQRTEYPVNGARPSVDKKLFKQRQGFAKAAVHTVCRRDAWGLL